MARRMKAAAETGDINGLYDSIKEDPNVLDSIDAIPFIDTPLHTAVSAGHTYFAVEILRLKPSFGRKLNPDGLSSLHLALINHKFDTVKRLIKLDKELIRVKGKQGETPLHFIAGKEDINTDQQQRVLDDRVNADQQQKELDDHRINTLAEFLIACPNSIGDLTNQDETALHIAVRTKNKSAVEIILGLIRRINKRRLLANKDDKGNTALDLAVENSQLEIVKLLVKEPFANISAKNLDKHTALDIALQRLADVARSERALENSSCDENYALAKFLNSPERRLEVLYKQKFFMGRSATMELRNIGLVVAVLIATATFTSVLSPPGGVHGGDFNLLSDGGNFSAMVTSNNNDNISVVEGNLFISTDNPAKRHLFDAQDLEYGNAFVLFYVFNTVAFVLSAAMIMFVLPGIPIFLLLHVALLYTMLSYGTSFYLISPSFGYCTIYVIASTLCASLVYCCRITMFAIENIAKGKRRVPFYWSKLQGERLVMLNNLLGNIN
ncbi:ankyrin repeat-containing protein BDA1-like [Rhododendron vialii]|uniref:ankyrin repeat-containing protein BDA1-like n=1 Tax=Rhododendron vialii TaxID=182163 RepID=UPI00265FE45E|nr:ankyrin repeat-containing protein BDA1-like [Rhododendron vialii]